MALAGSREGTDANARPQLAFAVHTSCRCKCHSAYMAGRHRAPALTEPTEAALACNACKDDHDRAQYEQGARWVAGLRS